MCVDIWTVNNELAGKLPKIAILWECTTWVRIIACNGLGFLVRGINGNSSNVYLISYISIYIFQYIFVVN